MERRRLHACGGWGRLAARNATACRGSAGAHAGEDKWQIPRHRAGAQRM